MAVSEHETGSQTATIDTVHTLNTTTPETTDGAFQLVVDVANLARGDRLELTIHEKARSGDTSRQAQKFVLTNEQDDDIFFTPFFIMLHGWDVKLQQTDGTGRVFPWSIRKA